jgi:hypothetical protein
MPTAEQRNPEHWHQRAEEARKIARSMTDMPDKAAMLEIAERYERLAARAAWQYVFKKLAGPDKPPERPPVSLRSGRCRTAGGLEANPRPRLSQRERRPEAQR